jgi:hypothetical protein
MTPSYQRFMRQSRLHNGTSPPATPKVPSPTAWCPLCRGWSDLMTAPQIPDPQAMFLFGYIVSSTAPRGTIVCSTHRWIIERMRNVIRNRW